MSLFFSNKLARLLLSVSVSIWMAGGCLLGCSNSVMAADASDDSTLTVEAGEGCHAAQSHDCCSAPKKPSKQSARNSKQPDGVPSFTPVPRGMTKDCQLVVNATVATSKSGAHDPDPTHGPVAVLSSLEKQTQHFDNAIVVSFLPNRGPTHLLCCVFLI